MLTLTGSSRPRRVAGVLGDAGLLLLGVYLLPVAILVAGAPIVLVVWLVLRLAP